MSLLTKTRKQLTQFIRCNKIISELKRSNDLLHSQLIEEESKALFFSLLHSGLDGRNIELTEQLHAARHQLSAHKRENYRLKFNAVR
jgi:hypothetical protein